MVNNKIDKDLLDNLYMKGISFGVVDINNLIRREFNDTSIKVNLSDEEDKYLIEGVFPGVDRKDIVIDYKNDYINIKTKQNKYESRSEGCFVMISSLSEYVKNFHVPNSDATKLKAKYEAYRLTLEIPKFKNESEDNIIDVDRYEEEK